jgi:hypothetical protein
MSINWSSIFKKHKGEWVALKADHKTVLASGKKAQTVIKKAKELGCNVPYLFHVPSNSDPYIG